MIKKKDITVVIPMAGMGKRFSEVGYKDPKPFIDVYGLPMIQRVVENLNLEVQFVFLVQKEIINDYRVDLLLNTITKKPKIIEVNGITEGPACTALLAKDFIDKNPLMIINCDQIIHDFNPDNIVDFLNLSRADGLLGTFISNSPKNSYVKLDEFGFILETKEKKQISNIATNGLHFWVNGEDFISSTEEMIYSNDRTNGEFYIAPSYNYLIKKGKKILPFFYNLHFPIGTPEDLDSYKIKMLHGDI